MRNRKPRRFNRYRSNGGGYQSRGNGSKQGRMGSSSFSENRPRNNFRPQQSAEKLVEKYSELAKEALSSGDRILSENYSQHADHFIRIISEKALNQNKAQSSDNKIVFDKKPDEDNKINQDQILKENKD